LPLAATAPPPTAASVTCRLVMLPIRARLYVD
jgi:hypothetical protein